MDSGFPGQAHRCLRAYCPVDREGQPCGSVGNVFNAAVATGVELFGEDRHALARKRRRGEEILGLLPTAVREVQDDDDEFNRI